MVPDMSQPDRRRKSPAFPLILGLALILIGGFFTHLMWNGYRSVAKTYQWPETKALLTIADVDEFQPVPNVEPRYKLNIEFIYSFDGQTYESTNFRTRERTTTRPDEAQAWLGDLKPGETTTCFVNPDNPNEAILQRDSRAALYAIWFPLLFVIGGLGMIIGTLRKNKKTTDPPQPACCPK